MSQIFYVPTKVFSGSGCVVQHAAAFGTLGRRALVVTGRRSAVASGALGDVKEALAAQGITCEVFDGIPPNPGFTEVREAAALARETGADFIVAIGGGSPLDAAKAVAVLATNDLSDDEVLDPLLARAPLPRPPLPVAAIPTTAGTGSEVTPYSILTNDKLQTKSSLSHESLFPKLAFLDARYTGSLPRQVTVNTALDALSHLVEGTLAKRGTVLSGSLAAQGLSQLAPGLRFLTEHETPTAEVRERLLLASCVAGLVIAHTGTTAVHGLGYSLTYFKNIDHGRANALTLGVYLEAMEKGNRENVESILRARGLADVRAFRTLVDALLGPREHLTADEVTRFAALAIRTRNIGNTPTPPDVEEIQRWYAESLP